MECLPNYYWPVAITTFHQMLVVFSRAVAIFEASSSHACYSQNVIVTMRATEKGSCLLPSQRLSSPETISPSCRYLYRRLNMEFGSRQCQDKFSPRNIDKWPCEGGKRSILSHWHEGFKPFFFKFKRRIFCFAKRFCQGLLVNLHKRANVYETSELFRLPISLSCQNNRLRANSSPRLLDDLINLASVNVKILCSQAAD